MQTKYLSVLIHIWIKDEVGAVKPVKYFTDRSKAVLLLWIFYVFVLSCVCYVFVRVCLDVLCGHLLGKGWPLGSRLWCLLWVCHFPGSGGVLDCIDSWSLHPYLLWNFNLDSYLIFLSFSFWYLKVSMIILCCFYYFFFFLHWLHLYFTPTKRSDEQPLVNLINNCPRKSIEKRGMSCNSVWIPTFVVQIPGQKVLSFYQIYFSRKKSTKIRL